MSADATPDGVPDHDAAVGPPAKMVERRDDLTPMMAQYHDLCARYDDSLVLFQVGDFYEAFCEAAAVTARLLDVTLTQREDSTGEYAMAGIPIDSAESYVEDLLAAGYRVAIADQVQDPDEATGVVDRAVTRILTPGTLTEDELLDTDDNNYVASYAGDGALAFLDVSTGDFLVTSVPAPGAVADEVQRFAPAEAIVAPEATAEPFPEDCMVTGYDPEAFDHEVARERVASHVPAPDAVLESRAETRAVGALLAYAEYVRGGEDGRLDYLDRLTRYDPGEYMHLDGVALRSLELFERRAVGGGEEGTLVGVVDETASALGSRKLKDWLRRPLLDEARIDARLDAVEELTGAVQAREDLHALLADVYDVERLITRVSRGRANARDLLALKNTLDVVPEVKAALAGAESDRLTSIRDGLDEMSDVRDLVGDAIATDPPAEITEGGVIADGFDEDLDSLRQTERDGREWVDSLEAEERERTGIDSLKVGFNSVHGYYIEVTKPNVDRVPDDYTRRQTLKNAERYYTPELKEREDEILRAEQRADAREHELFREVRADVAAEADRVQALAAKLAQLDVLVALAEVAVANDYCRPSVGGDGIHVEGGRHPVVEHVEESFVPNDTRLGDDRVAVITGPNMSGKSTYMRQVALICLLAQMGSFVPARAADLRIVDRIYTRVGASDDIAGGRSTFMVEMTELTDILHTATEDSLVLLDEVGRGTATVDGLAIARAVTEYLHDEVGATTLFATHHHELTAVADRLPAATNRHFDADRSGERIAFDHEIRPGATDSSYGVDVAEAAGVPDPVVARARELLDGSPERENGHDPEAAVESEALTEVRETTIAETTPLEALELLSRLKRDL
ncbi:MAG: DNA mismatch repair protein MutS [Halobacteriaceae archaeon]